MTVIFSGVAMTIVLSQPPKEEAMTRFINSRLALLGIAMSAVVSRSYPEEPRHPLPRVPLAIPPYLPITIDDARRSGFKSQKKKKKWVDPHRYQKQRRTGKSPRR